MGRAVDIIKGSLTMRDIFAKYGFEQNRAGFIVCPFHSEKTASLGTYANDKRWKCFGCGAGGDVISFVMKLFGLNFSQAVIRLGADFGFTDDELTNRSLLMVALFQKGLTGDVSAIKEIIDMMDKLDMFENTGKITSNVTINLVAKGETYQPNEADEQEIWDAENGTDLIEDDDEWGNDVYDG